MMRQDNRKSRENGVSESIGFLLIFAIIIAGIGLVTLYGYPLLLQQQVSADEKIMEKNMIVLQNDIKSLAYKTVPYKETSLKIGGGSLSVINPGSSSTIQITTGSGYDSGTFEYGELRYESISAQTDISLQNGAVVMRPRIQSGSTMLAEPRWFYDTKTKIMVISLIRTSTVNINDVMAKEGIGTVRIKLDSDPVVDKISTPGTIAVTYTSPANAYTKAWENYLTQPWIVEGLNNADTLYVKKYEIKILGI